VLVLFRDKVTVGPRLSELLDSLLEPLAEDRITPQEALNVVTGNPDGACLALHGAIVHIGS
jgi:hypothetical protein